MPQSNQAAAIPAAETDDARAQARAKARAAAGSSGWLKLILDHHEQVEEAFERLLNAKTATSQRSAQKWLTTLLTGHSIAEEAAIYPALALAGMKDSAVEAYQEQSEAKMGLAALQELEPATQEYLDKVEEIRQAVAHHVFEEESTWFLALRESAEPAA
jgi:hemerythrin superfamily protein